MVRRHDRRRRFRCCGCNQAHGLWSNNSMIATVQSCLDSVVEYRPYHCHHEFTCCHKVLPFPIPGCRRAGCPRCDRLLLRPATTGHAWSGRCLGFFAARTGGLPTRVCDADIGLYRFCVLSPLYPAAALHAGRGLRRSCRVEAATHRFLANCGNYCSHVCLSVLCPSSLLSKTK